MNSSAIRSHDTRVPSARAMSSAASTCQVSWGRVARHLLTASGWRPGVAGPRPALANQRWSVRTSGAASIPCRWSMTLIRPAPQVGCSWRSNRAGVRAGCPGSWFAAGPGRSGASPSGPRCRPRCRMPRTVRVARPNASASSVDEAPC